MLFILLMIFLLLGGGLFATVCIFIPVNFINSLIPPQWLVLGVILGLLFWCFGE